MRPRPPVPKAIAPPAPMADAAGWWFWLLLAGLLLLAYAPALTGGFLWDDAGHVTRRELQSWSGLWRIWTEPGATQQYYPLLHSAFWLEHRLWGHATLGYHLVNVLQHATAAWLLARLLLTWQVPGARIAAVLFALHPVCAESVAWISEQKNTLSTLLYLAAALTWVRFDADRRGRTYAVATTLFTMALLAKTVTATLPAALLVAIWWRRGRIEFRRDVLPLLPWFVLGVAAGLFTAYFERTLIGAAGGEFNLGATDRLVLAGRIFWFYLGSFVWPHNLTFIYPRWTIDAAEAGQWLWLIAALVLLAGLIGWSRRQRGPLAAGLIYAGTLFPALGFLNVYPFVFSFVADHFQYLSLPALCALAGAGLNLASTKLPSAGKILPAPVILLVLGLLTWRQSQIYRNDFTLYEATLARNPACWMAHNNLAMALTQAGRPAEAIPHLRSALALRPDYPQALSNLGDDLTQLGRPTEAIPYLERALHLQPGFADALNNLGSAYLALNRPTDAIGPFQRAVDRKPLFPLAHRNLGVALALAGRTADALPHFRRALELAPEYVDAALALAVAYTQLGRFEEARPVFDHALIQDPESVPLRYSYGRALATAGRSDEAIRHLQAALRLDDTHAPTHLELAQLYRRLGDREAASTHSAAALRLDPSLR